MPKNAKTKKTPETVQTYVLKPAKVYTSYPYQSYIPNCVGSFCSDGTGALTHVNDLSVFPHLKTNVALPLDLNTGHKDENNAASSSTKTILFHRVLRWILQTKFDLSQVEVVARRGIFKHIGFTLYNRYLSPWSFRVCKYQGVVYMYEPGGSSCTPSTYPEHQPWLHWGKRFEELVTSSDHVTTSPPPKGCYTMVTAAVSHVGVLLCAEVDAVCPVSGCLVELKTCTTRKLPDRLCFSWLQSFLAGVGKLHFGLRDGEGVVERVRGIRVEDAPREARGWDPAGAMGLVGGVVRWMVGLLGEGCSGVLSYSGQGEILLKIEEGHFLPEWYTGACG